MIKKIFMLLGLVCLLTFYHSIGGIEGAQTDLDLSSPEAAFHSLQKAANNKDIDAIEIILANIADVDNRKLAQELTKLTSDPLPWLMEGWKVLHVEYLTEESWTNPRANVWIELQEEKVKRLFRIEYLRGCLVFQKEGEQWKWLAGPPGEIGGFTFKEYDFSTPEKAYRSIGGAMFAIGAASDNLAIYEAISSHLKKGVSFEEYEEIIKEREKLNFPEFPSFQKLYGVEEEILPPQNGQQQAKVWELTNEGKRVSPELFIKEGSDWKWVPKLEYIWYPPIPYDYSTSLGTYQSIKRAEANKDMEAIFNALTNEVKSGFNAEDYKQIIQHRREIGDYGYGISKCYDKEPLEEAVEYKDGKQRVKVCNELFIKEGNEWKWVPVAKSQWHPKKQK